MRILILGGGIFLGRALLDAAQVRGHAVTVFNRGRARQEWPAAVQVIHGDRRSDLGRLAAAGPWDAVIDTCGYCPADVRAHGPRAGRLSALSVRLQHLGLRVARKARPHGGRRARQRRRPRGRRRDHRRDLRPAEGRVRARADAPARRAAGDCPARAHRRAGRPDRTFQLLAVARGGWRRDAGARRAASAPLQFIDVRDLADWMLHLLEHGVRGASTPRARRAPERSAGAT